MKKTRRHKLKFAVSFLVCTLTIHQISCFRPHAARSSGHDDASCMGVPAATEAHRSKAPTRMTRTEENSDSMDPTLRDYYKYQAAIMEPWDGPALVCFTDGDGVGRGCVELPFPAFSRSSTTSCEELRLTGMASDLADTMKLAHKSFAAFKLGRQSSKCMPTCCTGKGDEGQQAYRLLGVRRAQDASG